MEIFLHFIAANRLDAGSLLASIKRALSQCKTGKNRSVGHLAMEEHI